MQPRLATCPAAGMEPCRDDHEKYEAYSTHTRETYVSLEKVNQELARMCQPAVMTFVCIDTKPAACLMGSQYDPSEAKLERSSCGIPQTALLKFQHGSLMEVRESMAVCDTLWHMKVRLPSHSTHRSIVLVCMRCTNVSQLP